MSNFDYTKLPAEEVDCGVRKGKKISNNYEPKKKKKKTRFLQETILGTITFETSSKTNTPTSDPIIIDTSKEKRKELSEAFEPKKKGQKRQIIESYESQGLPSKSGKTCKSYVLPTTVFDNAPEYVNASLTTTMTHLSESTMCNSQVTFKPFSSSPLFSSI